MERTGKQGEGRGGNYIFLNAMKDETSFMRKYES